MMYKFILSLFLCTFIWASVPASAAPQKLDGIVAIVDSKAILSSDIDNRFQVIKDRIPGGVLTDTIRRQILNQLVEEAMQVNYARKLGIRASSGEVDRAILSVASNFQTDIAGLRDILSGQGIDYSRYRQQIENEILIGKSRQQVVQSRISITEQEIDDFLDRQAQKSNRKDEYRLRHIVIRATDLEETRAKIDEIAQNINSEQDFINQAIANSEGQFAIQGGDLGWRKANELPRLFTQAIETQKGPLIGPLQSNAGFHLLWVVEKQSNNEAYQQETKVSHILVRPNEIRNDQQTQAFAEQLYKRLQNGEDFAELAKSYSEDQGSTLQGGDLGWVTPGAMVPEFEQVMNTTDVGDISTPFRSQFGWHILTVDGRRQTDISEQVQRKNAEQALIAQKRDFVIETWLSELRADSFIERKAIN
ncbi:peptidylprolyl isomerase [Rhodanobacter aciditrophus]|uniref:Chaperone SurA n=1 Tax=Rhodanobacter aciditrophus TaxID=1623218 RepID=A0ABW4AWL8_9GAMM